MLSKLFSDDIFGSLECNVRNEEGIAGCSFLVSELLGTVWPFSFGGCEVDIEGTVVHQCSVHLLVGFDSILGVDEFDVAISITISDCSFARMREPAYPLERPVALSVMTRTPDSSPKDSNSLVSQSSSTFHDRLPTKRFRLEASSPVVSILAFFATGSASVSALRFLGASSSSSSLSSSDEPSSDPDSEDASLDSSDDF